jgi:hypothetical protein
MAAHATIMKGRVTLRSGKPHCGDKPGAADREISQANPTKFGVLAKIVIPAICPDNNLGDFKIKIKL